MLYCCLNSAVFCPWILAMLTAMDLSRDYTRLLRIPSKRGISRDPSHLLQILNKPETLKASQE